MRETATRFEGCRVLVPAGNKSFDCLNEPADAGEVCALQGAAAQDAKPAFDLIEPGAMGGNKVKMDVGMSFEPAILFGLVSVDGEIRILRFRDADPFNIDDVRADFEAYTGLSSDGCKTVDDDDYKAIMSPDSKCLARTPDPMTLYIEDFRFFGYEVAAGLISGK